MSFAELNGNRIISGTVTIPYYGLWTADVALAAAGPWSEARGTRPAGPSLWPLCPS